MAHVSFWQLGLHCVTIMLTPLPYNSRKSYCANTKLHVHPILIYRHAHCIESTDINAANSQYATKQSTCMMLLLYMLLNFKYIYYYLSLGHLLS